MAFYDPDPPSYLQQGDIIAGVPVLLTPPSDELLLLRMPETLARPDDLAPGRIEAVREMLVGDAFEQAEYVGVAAVRGVAMLMTQTCDLNKTNEYLVCPLEEFAGSGIDNGNLRAGKLQTLFHVPGTDYYGDSYIDFTTLRLASSEAVALKNRVRALTREAQLDLAIRFARALGRDWGHAPGDIIPKTGKYRCILCVKYDVQLAEIEVEAGEPFPDCPNCKRERKRAQWHQVLPLKKLR